MMDDTELARARGEWRQFWARVRADRAAHWARDEMESPQFEADLLRVQFGSDLDNMLEWLHYKYEAWPGHRGWLHAIGLILLQPEQTPAGHIGRLGRYFALPDTCDYARWEDRPTRLQREREWLAARPPLYPRTERSG